MPKRPNRRKAGKRRPAARRPHRDHRQHAGPLDDVAALLDSGEPLPLLGLVSSLLATLDPPGPALPVAAGEDPELPSAEDFAQALLGVPTLETSAVLTAMAVLLDDDLLRTRVRREVATRGDVLPRWLAELDAARPADRAVVMAHVLGDGEDVLIGATLPGGSELTCVLYVDHNMGTLVKDAFVVPASVPAVLEHLAGTVDDPDVTLTDLDPADARARLTEAIGLTAITFPPIETDSWPACRALVEWVLRLLPEGGQGYVRPEWSEMDRRALAERFLASPFAESLADPRSRDLVDELLWFGCDYGPGDPLRWSPVAVEILLLDWFPRKVVDEPDALATLPDLLRAFVRFSSAERGIRASLTEETLAAVDEFEPDYLEAIRRPRLQGLDSLLASAALIDPTGFGARQHGDLVAAVGGEEELRDLGFAPLPDEEFDWSAVPDPVRDRVAEVLALTDRGCDALFDVEYRTAARRLLARLAADSPDVLARGRADTTAASVCWLVARANGHFDKTPRWGAAAPSGPTVAELMGFFGVGASTPGQRGKALAAALGGTTTAAGEFLLGSPDFLVEARRRRLVALRDALPPPP